MVIEIKPYQSKNTWWNETNLKRLIIISKNLINFFSSIDTDEDNNKATINPINDDDKCFQYVATFTH